MPKWQPVTGMLILVVLAFNLVMLLGFFSLRADRRHCPEGWAGESCWEAQIVPAALADALPRWWVVGDAILGALWVTLGVGRIARRVLGESGPAQQDGSRRVSEPAPKPPGWEPVPAANPAGSSARPPAVFAPCPGCGRQVNRELERCPHCRKNLWKGGRDG
jgi:hypothetical protein